MCARRGKDGNFCGDGLPHVSKIEKQSKGVGTELKDAADSEMKVTIQIEKGMKEMYKEEYMDVYKKAGTAQVLHLIKPWHGTGRAVYADSAFASKLKSFIIFQGFYANHCITTVHTASGLYAHFTFAVQALVLTMVETTTHAKAIYQIFRDLSQVQLRSPLCVRRIQM